MNLSIRRKKSAESNKIDKTKLSVKNFKQIYQENKNRPLTKNEKRGWAILGGIIIAILVIAHVSNVMEQSRLEKDNVPIVISDVEDNIKLDYHTDKREISAKISGVSSFAEVKVSGDKTDIHDRKDAAGNIKYEVKNIKEGDSDISISVVDGKRHSDKTIKLHRQTKADYDKQELEKALKYTEDLVKKTEEQPTNENISRAKSDINRLPEDKRAPFSERIAKLEKAKQEEKERADKAKKEAEEKKKQEEAAAASARQQQQSHSHAKRHAPLAIVICVEVNLGTHHTLIETVTASPVTSTDKSRGSLLLPRLIDLLLFDYRLNLASC